MDNANYFRELLELAKPAGIFAAAIMGIVAWVFYKRWLSSEKYIREVLDLKTKENHENLKEYVGALAIIKERLNQQDKSSSVIIDKLSRLSERIKN